MVEVPLINEIVPLQLFSIPHRGAPFSIMPGFGKLQSRIEVVLANCRDIWERDYAYLAPHKKVKKRDAFEEWLYCRKEEDTVTDKFHRYSTAGSTIPATEKFDPMAWWSQPDMEEAFP